MSEERICGTCKHTELPEHCHPCERCSVVFNSPEHENMWEQPGCDFCDLLEMLVSEHCDGCKRADFVDCAVFKMHQRLQIDVGGGEPDGVCLYGFAYSSIREGGKATE